MASILHEQWCCGMMGAIMLANATALTRAESQAFKLMRRGPAANAPARAGSVPYWPFAFIAFGLLASAVWTAGLLYGAYRLACWALS